MRYFIDPSNSQDIRDWFQVDPVLGIVSLRQDMRDYYFNNNTRFQVEVWHEYFILFLFFCLKHSISQNFAGGIIVPILQFS